MKKETAKKLFNITFLVVVFGVTMWSVFSGEDLGQMIAYLKTTNLAYVIPSVLCVIGFILGESVILHYLFGTLGIWTKFSHCCLYSFIGFFYSCITPSASGGQPMQLIAMRKDKLPVGASTVVLALVTIVYKLVLVLLGAVVMLLRPAQIMEYLKPVEGLMYLGMGLNVVCIAGLLLVVFQPNVIRAVTGWVLSVMKKVRPKANLERWEQQMERLIHQYNGAAGFFSSHKRIMIHVFLITAVQRIVLFLVTWFTYLSFDLSGHSLPTVVTLQGMIAVAADMLPLPGGMGVSENLFLEIFLPIFGEDLVLPGMVISRGISYYTQMLLSAMMTVAANFIIRGPKKAPVGPEEL